MCIKWGEASSEYFTISNGVRQGGILSPCLFPVYVDALSKQLTDALSKQLTDAKSWCFIVHQYIDHVTYVICNVLVVH